MITVRPTINVIDMFHGDDREAIPNFVALKANGILAVLHKASQGAHYKDPKYDDRRKACQDAGLLFGAYHFLTAEDAREQSDFFLTCSGIANNAPLISLAADYENNEHSQAALHQCRDFMANVDQNAPSGISSILYSGNLIRETLIKPVGGRQDVGMSAAQMFFVRHRLWLAEYGPHENIPWPWSDKPSETENPPGVWLWQFTEVGRVNPIVGNVDGNFYNGTAEQLATRWLS